MNWKRRWKNIEKNIDHAHFLLLLLLSVSLILNALFISSILESQQDLKDACEISGSDGHFMIAGERHYCWPVGELFNDID